MKGHLDLDPRVQTHARAHANTWNTNTHDKHRFTCTMRQNKLVYTLHTCNAVLLGECARRLCAEVWASEESGVGSVGRT